MSVAGTITHTPEELETVARWKWAGLVVGLLVLQVLMGGFAALLAVSDPAFAVIPNYHDRSIHWDDVVAARQASAALGWKSQVVAADSADLFGKRRLTIRLENATGRPLSDAQVRLQLYHHARPLEIQDIVLSPDVAVPGQYVGDAIIRRQGLWEVELIADHDNQHYLATTREEWKFR